MRIPLNLASEPFRRDRQMIVASVAVGLVLAGLLAMLTTLAVLERGAEAQTRQEQALLQKKLAALNQEQARLEEAADQLMAAEKLPRERRKEARTIPFDLRPLVLGLRVGPADPAALPPDATASTSA